MSAQVETFQAKTFDVVLFLPDPVLALAEMRHIVRRDGRVAVEVGGTPLGERVSEEVYGRILADTWTEFARYCDPTGALHLPIEGAVITAESA